MVETVPGVSGGTMALVVGIYERLIAQGAHLVAAARGLLPGAAGGDVAPREELRRLDWGLLLPVALGMVLAVVAASQVLPGLIEDHPVGARAVFLGMVAASVAVPLRITGRLRGLREWALVVLAFAATFAVSALPPAAGEGRPPMPLVGLAAAIAVCALVLPGFSGSFLLLVFGLYEPTLRAVRDLDLAYIAVFGLGAVLGLASFVSVLTWLLEHHRLGPPEVHHMDVLLHHMELHHRWDRRKEVQRKLLDPITFTLTLAFTYTLLSGHDLHLRLFFKLFNISNLNNFHTLIYDLSISKLKCNNTFG